MGSNREVTEGRGATRLFLVTGGCGFIGSHLAEALLAAGHTVRVLDNLSTGRLENLPRATEFFAGDIADASAVRRAMEGVDGCFHLAALASVEDGHSDWAGTHRTNLSGTINIFDAARSAKASGPVPVVYASSAAVYGDCPVMPLAETAPARPLSAYGADKLGCELHARVARHVHGVPTLGLRFFNVFGPRQDPSSPYSGVISIFCDRLSRGRSVTIFGSGQQTRDFIYVADVVAALLAAMERLPEVEGVFNVCTGRAVSILELLFILADFRGARPDLERAPPRRGDIEQSVGDPSLAEAFLGFRARVSLEAGLRRTLASLADDALRCRAAPAQDPIPKPRAVSREAGSVEGVAEPEGRKGGARMA